MIQTVLLGDIIELIGGGTPKTSRPEFWGGDVPWLSVVDFSGDRRWVSQAERSITSLGLKNSSTKLLEKGDIIISARGTVGELAQLRRPMAFNQSCYGIRAKAGVDQDFLYYLLKKSVSDLRRQSHGGVFNTITHSTFSVVSADIPSMAVQKKIANILGSLDEKIELNRRMNENLEQLGPSFAIILLIIPSLKTGRKDHWENSFQLRRVKRMQILVLRMVNFHSLHVRKQSHVHLVTLLTDRLYWSPEMGTLTLSTIQVSLKLISVRMY